jgi:ATP adenylyltransferase/5',5'''-P-1,P-4-tetraphosphate phosphorylase II
MASKRLLKRDVNYVLGDIIDAAYIHQMANPDDAAKTEAIVDEAIADFDELITKINQKDVEKKKQHFKSIQKELEAKAEALVAKINAL